MSSGARAQSPARKAVGPVLRVCKANPTPPRRRLHESMIPGLTTGCARGHSSAGPARATPTKIEIMPRHGGDDAQTGLLAAQASPLEQSMEVSAKTVPSTASHSVRSGDSTGQPLPSPSRGKVRSFEDWEELRRLSGVPKRGGHPQSFEVGVAAPPWMAEAIAAPNGGNLPQGDATSNSFTRAGLRLHYRKWLPAGSAPKGAVCVLIRSAFISTLI